jgi:hypothetical protein
MIVGSTTRVTAGRLAPLRERIPAVLVHLGLSSVVFAVLMWLIAFSWYPGPFFAYDGGWRGTIIVVAVDLVLGPALTFVVFDPRKERRKTVMDLCVIGAIQVGALAWGFHAVESQRPVAASFYAGAFHPVTADLVRQQGGDLGRIAALDRQHPPLVYVSMPADRAGRERVEQRWRERGFAPQTQPALLAALAPHLNEMRAATQVVARIAHANPRFRAELDAYFAAHRELDRAGSLLVPFNGRYGNVVFVLDAAGRLRGVLTTAFEGIL